ncbi:hypothetical protein Bbelb_280440 [Branchiostoma belcheri]|nr:hypothetical protein Bbelb_280440 [Branchiostoma belcheri]
MPFTGCFLGISSHPFFHENKKSNADGGTVHFALRHRIRVYIYIPGRCGPTSPRRATRTSLEPTRRNHSQTSPEAAWRLIRTFIVVGTGFLRGSKSFSPARLNRPPGGSITPVIEFARRDLIYPRSSILPGNLAQAGGEELRVAPKKTRPSRDRLDTRSGEMRLSKQRFYGEIVAHMARIFPQQPLLGESGLATDQRAMTMSSVPRQTLDLISQKIESRETRASRAYTEQFLGSRTNMLAWDPDCFQ